MAEIIGGKTGSLATLFRWMLVLYPFLTLPVLLHFFLRPPRRARREPVNFEREPAEVPDITSAPEVSRVPVAPPSAAPAAVPLAAAKPPEGVAPVPSLTLERLLDVLQQASVIEEGGLSPREARPHEPTLPRSEPLSVPRRLDSTRITQAEFEALTAPGLRPLPEPAPALEPEGSWRSEGLHIPDYSSNLSPDSRRGCPHEDEYREPLSVVSSGSYRSAAERRTLAAAERVARNPRMKRWIRDVASDMLAKTGT